MLGKWFQPIARNLPYLQELVALAEDYEYIQELFKRTKVIYHYPILGERSYTTTEIEEVKNE